ncbi:MAG: PUA-like domain-containing protein [Piptocephalis tieghemiana]|nr:MAG: PUA-like domain-containing protein [Piptocephalis tieghemiana]
MFKKFNPKDDISGQSLTKSSVQRAIRAKILEQYPTLEPVMEDILPKKAPLVVVKCLDHVNLITVQGKILFYNTRDEPYFPTLRLLHQYPNCLPHVQVDRGAIKFVMGGANIMCPGLTSKGARLPVSLPKGSPCAVMAEGKDLALGIGQLTMSTDDIQKVNKGIGVENKHYLGDCLWSHPTIS